jgi:hypothetical protein
VSKRARNQKQMLRNKVDAERYMARYMKRYIRGGRKVRGDIHMQHMWIPEYLDHTLVRTPAPFHNGRKR